MIKFVVFLGNPGAQYSCTRHNVPWMLLKHLESRNPLVWREKFHGRIATYAETNTGVHFLVPATFMNQSGKAVGAAVKFHKIDTESILVVHDEIEIPFGEFGIRSGGGTAGHNGLKSIRDTLNSRDFQRLRIGIGRPDRGTVHSWVLGRFSPIEEATLPDILDAIAANFNRWLQP